LHGPHGCERDSVAGGAHTPPPLQLVQSLHTLNAQLASHARLRVRVPWLQLPQASL